MTEKTSLYRSHLGSLVLPFSVLILIPATLIIIARDYNLGWGFDVLSETLLISTGLILILCGIGLLALCIRMFSQIGKGTLAPWSPTKKLVVEGVYRHVRNPMITGVLIALLGESIVLSSLEIFIWCLLFWIGNHIYFIKSEEPGLITRFGDDFLVYMKNVPRWIPRRTPWLQESAPEGS